MAICIEDYEDLPRMEKTKKNRKKDLFKISKEKAKNRKKKQKEKIRDYFY